MSESGLLMLYVSKWSWRRLAQDVDGVEKLGSSAMVVVKVKYRFQERCENLYFELGLIREVACLFP